MQYFESRSRRTSMTVELGTRSGATEASTPVTSPEGPMSSVPENREARATAEPPVLDMKLEVVVIPVSDVDRAKAFYPHRLAARRRRRPRGRLPPRPDDPARLRVLGPVRHRPHVRGAGIAQSMLPGRVRPRVGARRARQERPRRHRRLPLRHRVRLPVRRRRRRRVVSAGRAGGREHGSFASFSDPDGNTWLLQEVTTRLPGRVDPATTAFGSAADLAAALRRAAAAHGEHEARTGQADPNWPDWYADYMVREHAGEELPT